MKSTLVIALIVLLLGCSKIDPNSNLPAQIERNDFPELRSAMKKIEPFFQRMGKPEQYDWLGSHREPGQTFDEYLKSNPAKPTSDRQFIYVLPLGKFSAGQTKIVNLASGYLEAFYDLPVTLLEPLALVHPSAKNDSRRGVVTRIEQIRTGYIMDKILQPILPSDAAALIAFTNVDLFPNSSMNFVFGQASMDERVGVWSLRRLREKADLDTFLRRTLKIAAHETGHMFSLRHCTKYECVMSGTNYLGETDRRPVDACSECMAKICWLSDVSPAARYRRLEAFCRKNGLLKEAAEFKRKADAVKI